MPASSNVKPASCMRVASWNSFRRVSLSSLCKWIIMTKLAGEKDCNITAWIKTIPAAGPIVMRRSSQLDWMTSKGGVANSGAPVIACRTKGHGKVTNKHSGKVSTMNWAGEHLWSVNNLDFSMIIKPFHNAKLVCERNSVPSTLSSSTSMAPKRITAAHNKRFHSKVMMPTDTEKPYTKMKSWIRSFRNSEFLPVFSRYKLETIRKNGYQRTMGRIRVTTNLRSRKSHFAFNKAFGATNKDDTKTSMGVTA
mmetsp:Transcript_29886/g.79537  ORF Transcript_29886/g.79537 Transcript_29886/m.79537 type:complete len:251 (+) Transcript_29886:350-1102(+)